MKRLDWWSPTWEEAFQELSDLIFHAYLKVKSPRDGYEYEVHDNSKLLDIFDSA